MVSLTIQPLTIRSSSLVKLPGEPSRWKDYLRNLLFQCVPRQKSRRHGEVPATQRKTCWGRLAHSNMSYHAMVYPPLIQQVTREEDTRRRHDAVSH